MISILERSFSMKRKKTAPMTKAERIAAAIRGDAVDRVPYSLWSHLPTIDLDDFSSNECAGLF